MAPGYPDSTDLWNGIVQENKFLWLCSEALVIIVSFSLSKNNFFFLLNGSTLKI